MGIPIKGPIGDRSVIYDNCGNRLVKVKICPEIRPCVVVCSDNGLPCKGVIMYSNSVYFDVVYLKQCLQAIIFMMHIFISTITVVGVHYKLIVRVYVSKKYVFIE